MRTHADARCEPRPARRRSALVLIAAVVLAAGCSQLGPRSRSRGAYGPLSPAVLPPHDESTPPEIDRPDAPLTRTPRGAYDGGR